MHGQVVAVQDDRDHFHIIEPVPFNPRITEAESQEPSVMPVREGMYSHVSGWPDHFEWDGWRSHD